MPLQKCRNFDEDGSRKLKPNGSEASCRPDCQFVHPSDPAWDRARPSGLRGRGGHPYAPRGRSQSSFGAPGSGANSRPLGSNRGGSSWDDFISGSSSNPAATTSGWGMASQANVGTSGWGDSATSDSGWGSNDVGVTERKSAELAASDVKASTSQWGGHNADWGSPGEGWGGSDGTGRGSANTVLESGWGQDSTSDQWGSTPFEATISDVRSSIADGGPGRIKDGSDAAKTADLMPPVIPADLTSSQHDQNHTNQHGRDTTTAVMDDPLPPERYAPSSPTLLRQPPVVKLTNESQARTQSEGNGGQVTLDLLSTDSEMSQLALCTAAMIKMRKFDAELVRWTALLASPRLVMPRVDKDLLQTKYQEFKDMQLAAKFALKNRTAQLGPPNMFFSVTRAPDTERLHQLEAWVPRAEGCLSNFLPEGDFTSHVKKEDVREGMLISKLTQLKERSDSLTGTRWQCQDPQFYNVFLDQQLQDKKDLIMTTIAKGQEAVYNHLSSTSLSTLQQQGEMFNQRLQSHAGELAHALLQSSHLEKDGKSRSILRADQKCIIEKLQTSIAQKKLQIQAVQKEMTQLQHALTLKNQQSHITSDSLDVYAPHIQRCISSYIEGNALSDIKKVFIKVAEEKVEEAWKNLQPLTKISIWMRHSNSEEEVEMKEIENSLLG